MTQNYRIQDLIDIHELQKLLDSLYLVAGIPSGFVDLDGHILTASAWQDICVRFHRVNPRTSSDCQQNTRNISRLLSHPSGHALVTCPRGLTDIATPLIIEGVHLANIFTGQFFLAPPDREQFRQQAAEFGFDEVAYLAALAKVPVISRARLDHYLAFITHLAEFLALQGLKELRSLEDRKIIRESEERLRITLEAARAGTWDRDLMNDRYHWDQGFRKIFGMDETGEAGFDAWRKRVHPADQDAATQRIQDAIADRQDLANEYRIKLPDGAIRWIRTVGKTFYSAEGRPERMRGLCLDVTAGKQVEEALRESEQRFQQLFDNMSDGVAVYQAVEQGRDFIFVDLNRTGQTLSKACLEEVIGRRVTEVFPAVERMGLLDVFRRVWQTGRPEHYPATLYKDDRIEEWVDNYVYQLPNGLVVAIYSDTTESRRAEEENARLQAQLVHAQRIEAIGVLAGGIAHDFNNILSPIMGYTELAREKAGPGSELAQDLDRVLSSAHRARDLVKQILAFSRQSADERMPIRIQPLVKESLKMLRASLPSTISIVEQVHPECGVVLASPAKIHQIVMNLCINAFQAMEKTGGVLSVGLKTTTCPDSILLDAGRLAPGECVELAVSDTGSGIRADIIGKIFDPYFTTKETGQGTGLGLSIVHGIIRGYGGTVTVESTLGQGATFHVYFPLLQAEAQDMAETEEAPGGRERILFVDDEEILAELSRHMLERLGYRVTACRTSSEAFAAFMRDPEGFDLVITDQTMPGMTGIELAQRMLAIRPGLPIILCTGFSHLVSEESAKAMGIREFALKPLTRASIGRLIRKVLDVHFP